MSSLWMSASRRLGCIAVSVFFISISIGVKLRAVEPDRIWSSGVVLDADSTRRILASEAASVPRNPRHRAVYAIQSDRYIYLTEETSSGPGAVRLRENSEILFALEGETLVVLSDDNGERETHVIKKIARAGWQQAAPRSAADSGGGDMPVDPAVLQRDAQAEGQIAPPAPQTKLPARALAGSGPATAGGIQTKSETADGQVASTKIGSPSDSGSAAALYAAASKSVFLIVVKSSKGELIGQATGFLIKGNRIVTNEHVVRDGTPYLDLGAVRLGLRVVSVDSVTDLAVLMPEGELSAPALELASIQPIPGTPIFTIGNPQGLEKSISNGIVAGVRNLRGHDLLQISAPISPGSSGGPVFTANGEVVGVTVGMLEGGQNLNFAVPASSLLKLLNGEVTKADVPSLLADAENLSARRWTDAEFSNDPDSPYQKIIRQMESSLSQALQSAGSSVTDLALVADKALELDCPALAVTASERLVEVKPAADNYLRLAKSLQAERFVEGAVQPDSPVLKRAEQAIRAAFRVVKQPNTAMYALLADILEDRELTAEAKAAFGRTYEKAKLESDPSATAEAIRGLIRTNATLQAGAESDKWFQLLVQTGKVNGRDWQQEADRRLERKEYREAGDSYVQAAQAPRLNNWTDWCRAAAAYAVVTGSEDNALETARACIKNGAGKKDSDDLMAIAHNTIAWALNQRGVFEEALSNAREAVVIHPENPFYQDTLAESFSGMRRFQEAVNAEKDAIRLSDGKYAWMHFRLGAAYFDMENWQLSEQSYERAASMDPRDDAAAYNVAICMTHLGFYRDAAAWYEEVLRRNPSHKDRQDLVQRIQKLRQ